MLTIRPRINKPLRGLLLAASLMACLTALTIGATASANPSRTATATAASVTSHTLSAAARLRTIADHALVSSAHELKSCLHRPSHHCTTARRAVQRSGKHLKHTERHLSKLAHGKPRSFGPSDFTQAPQLTVSGQSLTWTRVHRMSSYVFVRKVPGQADQYSVVNALSTLPPPVPGVTVTYSVRTNVDGSTWSNEQSISYPSEVAPTEALPTEVVSAPPVIGPIGATNQQAAPLLTLSGQTLSWKPVAEVSTYLLVQRGPDKEETYSVVLGTSFTPTPVPGATISYSVRTAVDGSAWAPDVTISYPPETTVPTPTPLPKPPVVETPPTPPVVEPPPTPPVVETPPTPPAPEPEPTAGGFEMAIVPGSTASSEPGIIHNLGAHSVRMEFAIGTPASALASTVEEYAKVDIRIMPLAGFARTLPTTAQAANLASWAAAYGPGGTFWKGKSLPADTAFTNIEFGNETSFTYQYSDNSVAGVASRAQNYALRFKEAAEGIHASNSKVGLLAQGDSGLNKGSTWVDNMFKAVPDLAKRVAGWTVHPYGPNAVSRVQEVVTQTKANGASSSIPIYATEWGLSTDNGRCLSENYGWNACMSYSEAASDLGSTIAALREHIGSQLKAVYLYQAQDLTTSGTSTDREMYFGALQRDGSRKGAYTTEVESLLKNNP